MPHIFYFRLFHFSHPLSPCRLRVISAYKVIKAYAVQVCDLDQKTDLRLSLT